MDTLASYRQTVRTDFSISYYSTCGGGRQVSESAIFCHFSANPWLHITAIPPCRVELALFMRHCLGECLTLLTCAWCRSTLLCGGAVDRNRVRKVDFLCKCWKSVSAGCEPRMWRKLSGTLLQRRHKVVATCKFAAASDCWFWDSASERLAQQAKNGQNRKLALERSIFNQSCWFLSMICPARASFCGINLVQKRLH